jgi:hypothetical protein
LYLCMFGRKCGETAMRAAVSATSGIVHTHQQNYIIVGDRHADLSSGCPRSTAVRRSDRACRLVLLMLRVCAAATARSSHRNAITDTSIFRCKENSLTIIAMSVSVPVPRRGSMLRYVVVFSVGIASSLPIDKHQQIHSITSHPLLSTRLVDTRFFGKPPTP